MSGTRRPVLVTLTALLTLGAVEIVAWIALAVSRPLLEEEIRTTGDIFREQTALIRQLIAPDSGRMLAVDSLLGWRYRAGHVDAHDQTNAQGVRSRREYAPRSPAGVVRVAAFGDSFVYGNEVGNADCWSTVLEELEPRLEVLNYGVGGYGADQAYLRFLTEGDRLSPQVVVLGFAPVDLRRLVNVYRRFISNRELPLVKPRYVLTGNGGLELLPSPVRSAADYLPLLDQPDLVREFGRHDAWYEPAVHESVLYDLSATVRLATALWIRVRRRFLDPDRLVQDGVFNRASTAFRIQIALFAQFVAQARARGAVPLVVIFPDVESVRRSRAGRPPVFTPLLDELRTRRITYLDLTQAFLAAPSTTPLEDWFMPGGHYSPRGNRLVAAWLGPRLLDGAGS